MMWIGKNRRFILISISFFIITVSFFVVPMYTGAVNTGDEVRCSACHVSENDEFSRSAVHNTIKCTSCHTISDFGPDLYSHNATTFACIFCHTEQSATQFYDDAHNNFSNASNATNIFTGSNEMCVACHTRIELETEWHRYNGTNITASIVNGTWEISISLFGDNVTTNYTNYSDYLNET